MSANNQGNVVAVGERLCAACGLAKSIDAFSGKQWANKAHSRKCKECIAPGGAPTSTDQAQSAATLKQKSKKASAAKEEPKGTQPDSKLSKPAKIDPSRMLMRYEKLADMLQQNGTSTCTDEEDPFICDITGALIDMNKDGRYHFEDGRSPDDGSAVCMSVAAFESFEGLAAEHPETWEPVYSDKAKWRLIPPLQA